MKKLATAILVTVISLLFVEPVMCDTTQQSWYSRCRQTLDADQISQFLSMKDDANRQQFLEKNCSDFRGIFSVKLNYDNLRLDLLNEEIEKERLLRAKQYRDKGHGFIAGGITMLAVAGLGATTFGILYTNLPLDERNDKKHAMYLAPIAVGSFASVVTSAIFFKIASKYLTAAQENNLHVELTGFSWEW